MEKVLTVDVNRLLKGVDAHIKSWFFDDEYNKESLLNHSYNTRKVSQVMREMTFRKLAEQNQNFYPEWDKGRRCKLGGW